VIAGEPKPARDRRTLALDPATGAALRQHRKRQTEERLHDMRHSYATAGLAAGVPPKVMSERLGHATVAFTLDTYTSALLATDRSAADVVAGLILGTV
jgi:integrase